MDKKQKFFFFFLFLIFFIFFANFSLAIEFRAPEINYPSLPFPGVKPPQVFLKEIEEGDTPGEQAFPLYVKYFYYLFLMVSGLLAFGVIVYGGFLYLISAGAPAKMIAAKEQITGGILGLVILLSSYLILVTINPQLVMLHVSELEKYLIPEEEISIPIKEEEKFVYFQIPTGKIIERAVLDEEAQEIFAEIILLSQNLDKKSKELRNLTEDLKKLTDACQCGKSSCKLIECQGVGCPYASCKKEAIKSKIAEIKLTIEEIKTIRDDMIRPQYFLAYNFSELEKAALLMSFLSEEIEDYKSMLPDKYFIEEGGQKVEFDYFSGWDDIKLRMDDVVINDPATFYFEKDERSEDIIKMAEELTIISSFFYGEYSPIDFDEVPEGILARVPDYFQGDPRWRNECLAPGETNCPIINMRRKGCLITSIASALGALGYNDWSPLKVLNYAKDNEFIWPTGDLKTPNFLDSLSNKLGLIWHYGANPEDFGEKPIISHCDSFNSPGFGNHFVVVKGIKDGKVYLSDQAAQFKYPTLNEYQNKYHCSSYFIIDKK